MSTAYDPSAWSGFFSAEAAATAALTGLVIVAISINIRIIVAARFLSGRAAETIVLLMGVLILATLGIVPGQSREVFGLECMGVGVWMVLSTGIILYRVRAIRHPQELRWLRRVFNAWRLAAHRPWRAFRADGMGRRALLAGAGGGGGAERRRHQQLDSLDRDPALVRPSRPRPFSSRL